ncbi:MAG: amidohydrolase family protein [Halobacteriota archaeon]|nr:amidohydrolase family protein [Halobacteriota archaeon]
MEYTLSGTIIYGDEFECVKGYVVIKDGVIHEVGKGRVDSVERGIILPAFVNAHTHIGDSVVKDPDTSQMTLEEIVGPGGLKHRILEGTAYDELVKSMKSALKDMISCGIVNFADFREGGVKGTDALRDAAADLPIGVNIFGRQLPSEKSSMEELLDKVDGLGISSVCELESEVLLELVGCSRKRGRQIAVHAGERDRSDIKGAIQLKPDHIVHLTKASTKDLKLVATEDIPVVVCLRSNLITGVGRPPIKEMLDEEITVAVGTDNVMLNSPNIFSECEFISKIYSIDDRKVLKMCTLNGAKVLKRDGEIGSISEGKVADLIVINDRSNNMVNVRCPISGIVRRARPGDIKATVYEGNFVVNNGGLEWKSNSKSGMLW